MKTQLKISEFAKLTGVTVKTVLHYHKIGLLDEPLRSPSGYRLYGAAELVKLQGIKHLKTLGMNLRQIKSLLESLSDNASMYSALKGLEKELVAQIGTMEARLGKVRELLTTESMEIMGSKEETETFQMIESILGAEYYEGIPDLKEQERQLYQLLDNYEWGINYQDSLRQVAEYFKDHPQEYQQICDVNDKIATMINLHEDVQEQEIDDLAKDCVQIFKCIPNYQALFNQDEKENRFESLFHEMVSNLLTPAQNRFCKLFQHFLNKHFLENS